MNFFRWIFVISLSIGMFWLLGFALEIIYQKEPSIFNISVLSIFSSIGLSFIIFKFSPNFLKDLPDTYVSAGKYYFLGIVASYFLLVPIFAAFAYSVHRLLGDSGNNEASIFIALFAIWFPLWWMVPTGLTLGWMLYKKKSAL